MAATNPFEFKSDRERCDHIIQCSEDYFINTILPQEEYHNYISKSFAEELGFYVGKVTVSEYFEDKHRPRFFQILQLINKTRDLSIYFGDAGSIWTLTEMICSPKHKDYKAFLMNIYESALEHLPAKYFLNHANSIKDTKSVFFIKNTLAQNDLLSHLKSFILAKVKPEIMNKKDLPHIEQILSSHRGNWFLSFGSTSTSNTWNKNKKTDGYKPAHDGPSIFIMNAQQIANKLHITEFQGITGKIHYEIASHSSSKEESKKLNLVAPESRSQCNHWITENKHFARELFLKLCEALSIEPVSTVLSDIIPEQTFAPSAW